MRCSTTQLWQRLACLATLAFILLFLADAAVWAFSPYLNEYREGAHADAVAALASGAGLYPSAFGAGFYLYGPLYPLAGWMCSLNGFFGTFLTLRLLSLAATLCVSTLGALYIYKESRNAFAAAAGFALLLLTDWQNVPGTATPAPLGSLLLLLAMLSAQRGKVLPAALATVLSFFVKPYFVAVWLPLQVFFALQGRRQGWCYFGVCAGFGAALLVLVGLIFPNFFVYNIVHHLAAASASWTHLGGQLAWCVLMFWPLFAIALLVVRRQAALWRSDAFLLCGALLFVVWLRLAMHTGAFLSYAYHLWLPPLVVFSLSHWSLLPSRRVRAVLAAGLLLFAIGLGDWRFNVVRPLDADQRQAWLEAEQRLAEPALSQTDAPTRALVVCSPALSRMAFERGWKNLDNGQTQYAATLRPYHPVLTALVPNIAVGRRVAADYDKALRRALVPDRHSVLLVDDRAILPPEKLDAEGYDYGDGVVLRIGLHDVAVCLFDVPPAVAAPQTEENRP